MASWQPFSDRVRGRPTRSSTSRLPSSTTTSSRPTGRWSRRSGARAPSGPRSGSRRSARYAGSEHAQTLGRLANENGPKLRTHDRYGHRVDEVEFHPAWHELLGKAVELRAALLALEGPAAGRPRRPRRRLHVHVAGRGRRRLPDLDDLLGDPRPAHPAELAAEWEPRFLSAEYDPRNAPAAGEARRPGRDGDDREAGRHRRPRQHHASPGRSTAAGPAPSTS